MKSAIFILAAALAAFAADKKALPNQAGNDDLELNGTVLIGREEIQTALGADLGTGYVVVKMKATPKTEHAIRVSADDFTLLSRKDGERSTALAPSQIAGRGALVVKAAARQPGGQDTVTNGPIWGGVGAGAPRRLPGSGGGVGNRASVESGTADAKIDDEKGEPVNPLLAILKDKVFPDQETSHPVEGLLYFAIDGKFKAKDLSLLYKGEAGRLVVDFR
jgi:hypothetical protein